MLIVKGKLVKDPAIIASEEILELRLDLHKKFFPFFIPPHISSNKDKKEYKTGFLNEIYAVVFPDLLKKTIFTEVTRKFDIFVDERQYQNMVHEYSIKKYSLFIKK